MSSGSIRRRAIRIGNRPRCLRTSLRGSCRAAHTTTPTRGPGRAGGRGRCRSGQPELAVRDVGGEFGELVEDDHVQRLDTVRGVRRVLPRSRSRHGLHVGHQFLEGVGRGFGRRRRSGGTAGLAGGQFHAAFEVEPVDAHEAGGDRGGELADQCHRTEPLPAPVTDGEEVAAAEPDGEGAAVLADARQIVVEAAIRPPPQVALGVGAIGSRAGGDDVGQAVDAGELQGHDAGAGDPERQAIIPKVWARVSAAWRRSRRGAGPAGAGRSACRRRAGTGPCTRTGT